ncbi:MAG: hypothetical protein QF464_24160, partial [Myxococcota bacterium]|nr:hypothetical protein [Myxococcota bacterium]
MDGLLRFGFVRGDMSLIDLGVAERRFTTTARLVKAERPHVAAQALVMAAYTTILGDKLARTHGYLEAAIGLDEELAEAHFLTSRACLRQGNSRGAYDALLRALTLDQGYAVRAGSIDATASDVGRTDALMAAVSRDLRRHGKGPMTEALQRLRLLANHPPAHQDPDVLTLRAFVRDEETWPVYDVIRVLAQRDQLLDDVFDRYREVRVISSEEQGGAHIQLEEVRQAPSAKRVKAPTAAQRIFGRDGDKEEPSSPEQRRTVTAELTVLSSTIRDISGRILTEFDLIRSPTGTFMM